MMNGAARGAAPCLRNYFLPDDELLFSLPLVLVLVLPLPPVLPLPVLPA